ncbi:hypothetical protein MTO96_031235 [Rhipicephalus appendiculatus]
MYHLAQPAQGHNHHLQGHLPDLHNFQVPLLICDTATLQAISSSVTTNTTRSWRYRVPTEFSSTATDYTTTKSTATTAITTSSTASNTDHSRTIASTIGFPRKSRIWEASALQDPGHPLQEDDHYHLDHFLLFHHHFRISLNQQGQKYHSLCHNHFLKHQVMDRVDQGHHPGHNPALRPLVRLHLSDHRDQPRSGHKYRQRGHREQPSSASLESHHPGHQDQDLDQVLVHNPHHQNHSQKNQVMARNGQGLELRRLVRANDQEEAFFFLTPRLPRGLRCPEAGLVTLERESHLYASLLIKRFTNSTMLPSEFEIT